MAGARNSGGGGFEKYKPGMGMSINAGRRPKVTNEGRRDLRAAQI